MVYATKWYVEYYKRNFCALQERGTMLGPVDYVVVGFKGNNFDGSILDELTKAAKNKTIRIIDLLFVMKDKDGEVIEGEFSQQSDELKKTFGELEFNDDMPLLTVEDVEKIGKKMENDTAAGILVIEHLWAKGLKKALIDAGGFLIDDGRIHDDKLLAALEDIKTLEPINKL